MSECNNFLIGVIKLNSDSKSMLSGKPYATKKHNYIDLNKTLR